MNHLATIQSEFVKEARKWKDLTYDEQKGYLKRHPRTKRKLTAKPDGSSTSQESSQAAGSDDESTKNKILNMTYADFAEKLSGQSKSSIKDRIEKLQFKMDRTQAAAARREQRAQGDLDGTAFEAAYERNRPLEIEQKLLKHFLEHGNKKLPPELQQEFDEVNKHKQRHSEYKQEQKTEKEKHAHLIGKKITWISSKYHGQEMSGIVIGIKSGRHGGIMAKTDTGWRVPISLIKSTSGSSNVEKNKEKVEQNLVKAKDLIGKNITWKSKFTPGKRHFRNMPGAYMIKQPPPGYDSEKGTASGKVTEARGSKVVVGGWRIPLALIHEVDGKKFSKWK